MGSSTRSGCRWALTALALLFVSVLPAVAYVKGNYMYHFWRGLGWAIEGERRAAGELNYGLRQLRHCRSAVERQTERIERKRADLSGDEAFSFDLVTAFHRERRLPTAYAEEERQQRILEAVEGTGPIPIEDWRDDLAVIRRAEDAALVHDVEAFFAEQRDRDFARGLAERERAAREWRRAAEAVRAHAGGLSPNAPEAEARRAYLAECAERFQRTADFLQEQLGLARDPQGMLARYAFYARVAQCYDATRESQQERIWGILRDTYRGKVLYAIELAQQEGVHKLELDRVRRQAVADRIPNIDPSPPTLYHLPEMELPFYHYCGTGKGYGSTTAISNALLKHNRHHGAERKGKGDDHGE